MAEKSRSVSPTVLLRISDGTFHMHRSFHDFTQAVRSAEAYAGAGCQAMDVWLTKLEAHLEGHSAADTRKLLKDRQMSQVH